jgi:bifunctional oligoribonuclease and PAP phosphatase NrnA
MRDERFAKEFAGIAALVETRRRFLLFGHVDPDGDCIGSMLALAAFLRGSGKEVACFAPGDMAEIYLALPLAKLFVREDDLHSFGPEMVFALDSPTTARTADLVKHGSGVPVVNIDHHPTNERYGDINVVDERASAAAILVYRFLAATAPGRITPEMADYLYLGVLMDTGGFRFRNTNAEALATAARFVELGARAHELAHDFIYVKKLGTLKLLARALDDLEVYAGGRIAAMRVSRAMLAAAGAAMSDTEGFVDYAASIDDVDLAALFREVGEREIRVSLRSRGGDDVASLAEKFGGGGHRNAAGLTIRGDLPSAVTLIVNALEGMLKAREGSKGSA